MKKCDRESARSLIHTLTDANRFYNLSHMLYATDKYAQFGGQLNTP